MLIFGIKLKYMKEGRRGFFFISLQNKIKTIIMMIMVVVTGTYYLI
jgi:hypothetical protein